MADYQFRYSPLTGRLTGNQMIEQTEQAINQLSSLVDSAAGQVEIISTLANEANENAATALETAEEALATTGRTYITVSTQTDANNYYDSQLIYIADSTSTNIPVADTGMLEVKTNDNKTACEQVFIAASSGDAYYRNGAITAETVGDVTTYSVTWGGWSSQPASQAYVQEELVSYAPLSSLDNYLPLSGGTVSGDLAVSGDITGNLTGNVTGNASGNLPLAGGTMTGAISFDDNNKTVNIAKNITGNHSFDIGWFRDASNRNGSFLTLRATNHDTNPGAFSLTADDGTNSVFFMGYPNGSLTWNGNDITPQKRTESIGNDVSVPNNDFKTLLSFSLGKGTWIVNGVAEYKTTNGSGLRTVWFSDTNNGAWLSTACISQVGGSSAGSIIISTTYIFSVNAPTTYYLVARQTSGSVLTAAGKLTMFRLSPIA